MPPRSFDVLTRRSDAWTASAALDLLPGNSGPRVEVLRGCVVITPGSDLDRRTDVIDRAWEYAAVGVPYFLRVDLRNRVPSIALLELVDGEYRPLVAGVAGSTFAMRRPLEFAVDPAELLDEEEPPGPTAGELG